MMIGADVVDIQRLRDALKRCPGLSHRLFTDREISYCNAKADPSLSLAGTLAAKEAVIKALRLGNLPAWARRVEIVRTDGGAPVAQVAERDRSVPVSISHDGGVALAVALDLPPAQTGTSQMGSAPG